MTTKLTEIPEQQNGTLQVADTIKIPGKPAEVIPEVAEQEIKLPVFLKKGTRDYYRIDSLSRYMNVWNPELAARIAFFDYGEGYSPGEITDFINHPDRYEIISEEQFNEAFTTALSAIATAHGGLDKPEYSTATDETKARANERYMSLQESITKDPFAV